MKTKLDRIVAGNEKFLQVREVYCNFPNTPKATTALRKHKKLRKRAWRRVTRAIRHMEVVQRRNT